MKKVTINLDEATLGWIREQAATSSQSVSRWVADRLEEARRQSDERLVTSAGIEQFLADFPGLPLSENGRIHIDRDELYDDGRFQQFD